MKQVSISNILSQINMRYLLDKSYINFTVIFYIIFGGKRD